MLFADQALSEAAEVFPRILNAGFSSDHETGRCFDSCIPFGSRLRRLANPYSVSFSHLTLVSTL